MLLHHIRCVALLAIILYQSAFAAEFHIIADEAMIKTVRIGTPVVMLGKPVGKVQRQEFSSDGRKIDVTLAIQDQAAEKLVNSVFGVVGKDNNGAIVELRRRADPLGVRFAEVDDGLLLEKVFDSTSASRMGLKVGDILRGINSEPIRTRDAWKSFVQMIGNKEKLQVRVLRDGKEGTQIGVADFSSGAIPVIAGSAIPLELSETGRTIASAEEASAAVKRAADGLLPQLKSTLSTAMELGDVFMRDVDMLIGKANSAMDEELAELIDKMDGTLDELGYTLERVTPKAESTIDDYDRIGQMVESLLYRVEGMMDIVEGELQYLPGSMASANQMLYQSSEMVDAVRHHWIMRRMVDRQRRRCRR